MSESRQLTTTIREIASSILGFSKPQCLVAIVGLSGMLLSGVAQANTPFTTPASYTVGNDGSANVVIPIQVPPGTNGMQPSLNFNYNSNRGNGLMGLGWSIGGVSSITRCGSTVATEGTRRSLQLDSGDKFCLDGQKLKVVNGQTYGSTDAEYRTELANFAKITNTTSNVNNGPDSFEVKTKNGKTITYGSTADATIKVPNKEVVRSWLVKKVSDRQGNFMTFNYTNDSTTGQFNLSQIDYTDHITHSPFAKVVFKYDLNRQDKLTTYFEGFAYQTTKRLTNIQTFNEDAIVKDYRLEYKSSQEGDTTELIGRTQLKSIQECDGIDTANCLEKIQFHWANPFNSSFSVINNPIELNGVNLSSTVINQGDTAVIPNPNADESKAYIEDFNGDGRDDMLFLVAGGGTTPLFLSKGDGSWDIINKTLFLGDINLSRDYLNKKGGANLILGDYNGDGLTDFHIVSSGLSTQPIFLSDGKGDWEIKNTNYPSEVNGISKVRLDVNNDGRHDYLFIKAGDAVTTTSIMIANGDGTWSVHDESIESGGINYSQSLLNNTNQFRQYISGDFNGDGLKDFGVWYTDDKSKLVFFHSNGDGSFEVYPATVPFNEIVEDTSNPVFLYTADFNGDGSTDLIFKKRRMDVTPIMFSKGDGTWDAKNEAIMAGTYNVSWDIINNEKSSLLMSDLNGDGLSDILVKFRDGSTTPILISKGNGDWWYKNDPIIHANQNFSHDYINERYSSPLMGDFNGDGLPDILIKTVYENSNTPLLLSNSGPLRLLESVNFGLDRKVEFDYNTLAEGSPHYVKGGSQAYPERAIQDSRKVVGKVSKTDGNGGKINDYYSYSGLKIDLRGRDLGFATMNKLQDESGILTSLSFSQTFPYIGMVNKKEIKVATNDQNNPFESIEEVTNTYKNNVIDIGGVDIYFSYLDQSVDKKKVLTVDEGRNVIKTQRTYKTVTTSKLYDDYGNATQVKTTYDDGHVETVSNTYTNDEDNWLIGRLDQSKITRTNNTVLATINTPTEATNEVAINIDIERISLGVTTGSSITTNQSSQTYQVGETVNLVASVNSPDDSVAKVEFFVDGNSIGEATSSAAVASGYFNMLASNEVTGSTMTDTSSYLVAAATQTGTNTDYNISWTVTAGNHSITAVAFDANKNPLAVQASTINTDQSDAGGSSGDMTPPNTAPTLEVLNLGPTVEYAGDKIDFMAVGRDVDGVDTLSNVEFKLDGQVMSSIAYHTTFSDDNHRKYFWSWPAADSTEGQHTVTVSINDGQTTVTASKTFTLNPADTTTGDIVLLSQGKPTEQSSDWPNLTVHSALAVDGNYENQFRWDASNSITHTLNETNAWWQVDLGQVASIDRVKVWNRADHSDPLTNVYIFVSPTDMRGRSYADIKADSSIKRYHHETQMGVAPDYTHEVSMDGFAGRYVRIQLAGTNQLTLAEVEVYGSTGGSSSGGSTPSNTPPTVSVAASNTSPAVDDVVILTATAADSDGSITQVEFLVDNVLVKTVLAAPYSYEWTATEGSHEIKAKATDSSNAVTTSSIVNVDVTAASNNNNNGTVELLSQGKPATQSTTLDLASSGVPTGADLAVDGNTNGNFQWSSSNSLTHTGSETENEAWWQVDLGQSASVERVKLWNRTDCCANRLQYFYIFVSDNDMTGKTVQQLLSDSTVKAKPVDESLANDVSKEFILDNNPQGRYVKIQLTGTGYLSLAEVEVFGIAGGSSGSGDTGSGGGDTTPPANQAPSVTIETPADGSSSVDGNSITITAVAGDNDGTVASVAFYNNGTQLLGSANTTPYSVTWNNAPVGTHSITAVATDNAGATTTSSAHSISVTADTSNNSGSGTTLYSEDFSGSTHSLTVWGGVQVTGLGTSTGKVLLENFNQASQNWPGYRSAQTFDYVVGQVFRAEVTTGGLSGLDGKVFIEGQQTDGSSVQLRANFGQVGFSYHFVDDGNWNYGGGTGTAIKANTTYIVEIEMKANGPALYVYEQGSSRASSTLTYEVTNGAWSNYQLRGEGYQGPSVGGTTQLSVDNLTITQP